MDDEDDEDQKGVLKEHPDLFISMLQGGDYVGQKGKIYKFMIMVPGYLAHKEKFDIITKITEEIKQ